MMGALFILLAVPAAVLLGGYMVFRPLRASNVQVRTSSGDGQPGKSGNPTC